MVGFRLANDFASKYVSAKTRLTYSWDEFRAPDWNESDLELVG